MRESHRYAGHWAGRNRRAICLRISRLKKEKPNFARSAALRPSKPKAGMPGAAAREPAAQGRSLSSGLYGTLCSLRFAALISGKTLNLYIVLSYAKRNGVLIKALLSSVPSLWLGPRGLAPPYRLFLVGPFVSNALTIVGTVVSTTASLASKR